ARALGDAKQSMGERIRSHRSERTKVFGTKDTVGQTLAEWERSTGKEAESFDKLGAVSQSLGEWKGTKISRGEGAESFDKLGAVSQSLSEWKRDRGWRSGAVAGRPEAVKIPKKEIVGEGDGRMSIPCAKCRGTGKDALLHSNCAVCLGRGEVFIRAPAIKCVFCGGRGTHHLKERLTCTACKGKGMVPIKMPAIQCAYCGGCGRQHQDANLICIVCAGKGVVNIKEPVKTCDICHGTGMNHDANFYCPVCKGKGVVTVREQTSTR
ncbi:MAG: hypothetical protein ACE5HH_04445, partial [Candidatus Hydrothermarchaeales archaeon]